MKDLVAEGLKVVQAAEVSLRELMQAAVQGGQYDRVAVLARWAEELSQITANGTGSTLRAETAGSNGDAAASGIERRPACRKKGKRRKSKYPIFKRSGDNLIKIAWSKASKAEYQHQAPKSVIFALVEKMELAVSDDLLITMDNVLPIFTEDQGEVPAYQSYASLAWLREIGVVQQHGRQGYSVRPRDDTRRVIENAWQELLSQRR